MNNVGINLTYKYLRHNGFDDTFDLTVLCDVRISLDDKQNNRINEYWLSFQSAWK